MNHYLLETAPEIARVETSVTIIVFIETSIKPVDKFEFTQNIGSYGIFPRIKITLHAQYALQCPSGRLGHVRYQSSGAKDSFLWKRCIMLNGFLF